MRSKHLLSKLLLTLVLSQVAVVLGSWLWTAAMPASNMHSLLSDSGIRWFFGTFVENQAKPLIVWLLLCDIAVGCWQASGLWVAVKALCQRLPLEAQQKSGLQAAIGLMVVEAAVILLLTLPFHAVLLSVTGHLIPSSFSVAFIPILAFMAGTVSIAYGLFSGILHNYHDVFQCFCHGTKCLKQLVVLYVLATELYCSIVYVCS